MSDASLNWDAVIPREDRLTTEELLGRGAGFPWNSGRQSSWELPPDVAAALERLWSEHVAGLGW